jgi:hypothetical protein
MHGHGSFVRMRGHWVASLPSNSVTTSICWWAAMLFDHMCTFTFTFTCLIGQFNLRRLFGNCTTHIQCLPRQVCWLTDLGAVLSLDTYLPHVRNENKTRPCRAHGEITGQANREWLWRTWWRSIHELCPEVKSRRTADTTDTRPPPFISH